MPSSNSPASPTASIALLGQTTKLLRHVLSEIPVASLRYSNRQRLHRILAKVSEAIATFRIEEIQVQETQVQEMQSRNSTQR